MEAPDALEEFIKASIRAAVAREAVKIFAERFYYGYGQHDYIAGMVSENE